MSASLKPLTVDEFLAWERAQPLHFEFDGIQPVAMTGGSTQHARIQARIVVALGTRVAPPCEVFGSELQVVTATRVRYPDATVAYGVSQTNTDIVEPTAIFEVLLLSAALTDRRVKPHDYASVPSIQVYAIFDAEQAHATAMRRSGAWEPETYTGADTIVPLPEIGVELPLNAIYRRSTVPNLG